MRFAGPSSRISPSVIGGALRELLFEAHDGGPISGKFIPKFNLLRGDYC